jgi:hypothetical protein
VRLGRDGTVIWRTSTELSAPTELLDLGARGSVSIANGEVR